MESPVSASTEEKLQDNEDKSFEANTQAKKVDEPHEENQSLQGDKELVES